MASVIGFAVSAALGIISGAMGRSAAKRARDAEIRRIRMQTAEEIRRRTGAFQQEVGSAKTLAGAAGFGVGKADEGKFASGGFGTVLEGMQKEFAAEVDWLNRAAQAGIDETRSASRRTISTIDLNTLSNIGSSFTRYGEAKNWWQ